MPLHCGGTSDAQLNAFVTAFAEHLGVEHLSVEEAGRFFGLYALSGRATSFLAPMTVASLTVLTDSARIGMCALIVFLIVGFLILLAAPYPAIDEAAQ